MPSHRVSCRSVRIDAENSRQHWLERTSALVALNAGSRNESGNVVGYGEASPLPTVSPESVAATEHWLKGCQPAWAAALDANSPGTALRALEPALVDAPSSARYALELALLDAFGQQRGLPLWRLLCELAAVTPSAAPELPAAQLFNVWQADYLAAFERLALGEHATLKVKVGRDAAEEGVRLLALRRRAPRLRLRLDANRGFGHDQWQPALVHFAPLDIEFLEEPCEPAFLGAPRPLAVPLAFDETVYQGRQADTATLESWVESGAACALVLKPMLLGGFQRTLRWIAWAANRQTPVLFSHVFDGAVALRSYQHWDRALGARAFAAGLGVHAAAALWSEFAMEEP
jgi:L-alanine-DL-glutamate epimerase-like enolase superfamily enzyme